MKQEGEDVSKSKKYTPFFLSIPPEPKKKKIIPIYKKSNSIYIPINIKQKSYIDVSSQNSFFKSQSMTKKFSHYKNSFETCTSNNNSLSSIMAKITSNITSNSPNDTEQVTSLRQFIEIEKLMNKTDKKFPKPLTQRPPTAVKKTINKFKLKSNSGKIFKNFGMNTHTRFPSGYKKIIIIPYKEKTPKTPFSDSEVDNSKLKKEKYINYLRQQYIKKRKAYVNNHSADFESLKRMRRLNYNPKSV